MPATKSASRKSSRNTASFRGGFSFLAPKVALPLIGMFALVSAALVYNSFAATTAPSGFVYRNGSKLMLNGSNYQFIGFNAFGITGCEGASWTRVQLDAYFAQLPPASVTRFWAFKTGGTATIDQVIASAEAHNQKVAPVLDNDLADCTNQGAKTGSWYASGYKTTLLPWAQTMASKYKNSPAVAFWEVINEAGQDMNSRGTGKLDGATMQSFYNTVAGAIKTNDPNHLIGTGDNGEMNYTGGTTGFKTASSASNIDILSLHDYEYDYVSNAPVISSHFSGDKSVASALGKPIVIGEMNLSACKGVTTTARSTILKQRITTYLSGGASGVLVWNRSQTLYGNNCAGENYIISGSDPAINMMQNYIVTGVVATPPTSSIPTTGDSGSGGTTAPTVPVTDKTAPTVPTQLRVARVTNASATISWAPSNDNLGVTGYAIYRNGQKIASQAGTSLTVYGLKARTGYTFSVKAYDAAGNLSAPTQVTATTAGYRRWWW